MLAFIRPPKDERLSTSGTLDRDWDSTPAGGCPRGPGAAVSIFVPSSTTPLSFEAPAKRNPASICIYLIFPETTVIGLHFYGCMYGSIFIQFCAVASKIRTFSASECVSAVQGHPGSFKVDDFGTNWKRVYDFLLVGHCDYSPILHRVWNMAIYWQKIAYFSYPSLIRRLVPYVPFGILR